MKDKTAHLADIAICTAGIIAVIFLGIRYVLPSVFPVLLGYIFAIITYPISDKIASRHKKHARTIRGTVCIIMISAILLFGYIGIKHLVCELIELIDHLSRDPKLIEGYLDLALSSTENHKFFILIQCILSRAGKYAARFDTILQNIANSLLSSLTAFISRTASATISKIPSAVMFSITFFSSAYYFCADKENISMYISRIFPHRAQEVAVSIRTRISRYLMSYLKASAFMFFTTLSVMLIFLLLTAHKYAFIISLFTAAVDFLPILGAGTVIIPWTIYSFITGNTSFGILLMIILLLLTFIRKIAEPKIIGKEIGLHPLSMIASVYIATKIFGLVGIIAGPVICCILQSAISGNSKLSKRD